MILFQGAHMLVKGKLQPHLPPPGFQLGYLPLIWLSEMLCWETHLETGMHIQVASSPNTGSWKESLEGPRSSPFRRILHTFSRKSIICLDTHRAILQIKLHSLSLRIWDYFQLVIINPLRPKLTISGVSGVPGATIERHFRFGASEACQLIPTRASGAWFSPPNFSGCFLEIKGNTQPKIWENNRKYGSNPRRIEL